MTQIVAADVVPVMLPLPRRMTPAPKHPIPVTTWEAILDGSLPRASNAKDMVVKMAAPMETKANVSIPAGLSLRSRSRPTTAPQRTATKTTAKFAHGFGIN
jgi:hypothetical protein